MQRIDKGPEPAGMAVLRGELAHTEERTGRPPTPKDWNDLKFGSQTKAMREALYNEQHGLCAYCQCALKKSAEYEGPGMFTIEHIKSRKDHPRRMFDWDNLVAVCPGKSGAYEHCDTLRGSQELNVNPTRSDLERQVRLGSPRTDDDGFRILPLISDDPTWQTQLDEVLGLNNPVLGGNRLHVRTRLRERLRSMSKQSPRAKRFLTTQYSKATESQHGVTRPAYARVIADYCDRKLRQWNG